MRASLAGWFIPLLAAGGVVTSAFVLNIRDREHAYQLAATELRTRLDGNEQVLQKTRAIKRHWYDMFRATYGVLAATDRQVVFVGVVPELYRSSDAPRLFEVKIFPYDSTFHVRGGEVPLSVVGVKVGSDGQSDRYGIPRRSRNTMATLMALASSRSLALVTAHRRARAFRDSVTALPLIRDYYRVQRGDALEVIARHHGTTLEELRELNDLASDRIVVGQELVVRERPHPIPPCPPSICGIISASGGEVEPPGEREYTTPPRPEPSAAH